MYGCESWTIKKAECQRTDAFELWCWRRLLRVPRTARRSNQSTLKEGNQPWIFTGRTDAEGEAPTLWPPNVKSRLIGKDPDAGKDWRQKKRAAEAEMVREDHWLNGHEFEQTQADGEGQGRLACFCPWSLKELDATEWLNNNNTSMNILRLLYGEGPCVIVTSSLIKWIFTEYLQC